MYQMILEKIPQNWNKNQLQENISLPCYTEEYKELKHDIGVALDSKPNFITLERIQDAYAYGQFLLRGQLLAFSSPLVKYYQVRRYIVVRNPYKEAAIQYNLDYRRCGLSSLRFSKTVHCTPSNSIIFVVQVITSNPDEDDITPKNSGEYYIEYVATLS